MVKNSTVQVMVLFSLVAIGGFVTSCQQIEDGPIRPMPCSIDTALTLLKAPATATRNVPMVVTTVVANVSQTCTITVRTVRGLWLATSSNGTSVCAFPDVTLPQPIPPGSNWLTKATVTPCGALSPGSYWVVAVANKTKLGNEAQYGDNTNSVPITIN